MRVLSAVQAILALAFILFGLAVFLGAGIPGLMFLGLGAVFAGTAAVADEGARAGAVAALSVDAVLAYMAARKLGSLFTVNTTDITLHQTVESLANMSLYDYLPPFAALALVGIGALAVLLDWRALRNAPWF